MSKRSKAAAFVAGTLAGVSYLIMEDFWTAFADFRLESFIPPTVAFMPGNDNSTYRLNRNSSWAEGTWDLLSKTVTAGNFLATATGNNLPSSESEEDGGAMKEKIFESENYLQRALDGHFPIADELPQIAIMKAYIGQHSQQVLLREKEACVSIDDCPALQNRTFIVGRYSCPIEAGNRIHKVINNLIWAILSNRTFLLDYFDEQACIEEGYRSHYNCSAEGRKDICDEIMTASTWVPLWSEWKTLLGLPNPPSKEHGKSIVNFTVPYDRPDSLRVFQVGHQINQEAFFDLAHKRHWWHSLQTQEAQARIPKLFGKEDVVNHYFTYGMLFEALFTLSETLLPDPMLVANSSQTKTLAIHSRHPQAKTDGSYVYPEVTCIDHLLQNSTLPCTVYIMADRPIALQLLSQHISNISCTPIFVNHTQGGTGLYPEHGPFAGVGFFRDWALARSARHGMISFHMNARTHKGIRSSSALIRESIEFRRVLESASIANITRMEHCYNPWSEKTNHRS